MTQQNANFDIPGLNTVVDNMYDVKFPGTNIEDIVPVDSTPDENTLAIQQMSATLQGKAEKDTGTNTIGAVASYKLGTGTIPITVYNIGFQITDTDIKVAANSPMVKPFDLKTRACFQAYRTKVYDIGLNGVDEYKGITNTTIFGSTAFGAGNNFETSTGIAVYNALTDLIAEVVDKSSGTRIPDRIALPIKEHTRISKMLFENEPNTNVHDAVVRAGNALLTSYGLAPNFRIIASHKLKDRAIAYQFNGDAMVMYHPQTLLFKRQQDAGTGFNIPGNFAVGPIDFRDATAGHFLTGITAKS